MRIRHALLAASMLVAGSAFAQLRDIDPDWKETEVPPPPSFRVDHTIALDMPAHVTVKVGVDPDTLRVTDDGIVRYVVVARSPGGSVNASYEGIRCLTGEVKVYARSSSSGTWRPVANADWKPLNGNQPSAHALVLARQGACDGRAPSSGNTATIIGRLKSSPSSYQKN